MEFGKQRRMQRIFKADGRTLIVAMDHAAYMPDVVVGLQDPGRYIQEIHAAGADAVMTTLGTIRKIQAKILDFPVILSMESGYPNIEDFVAQGLKLGVDMLKCMVYPFSSEDPSSLNNFARLANAADAWSMPVMAEVFPGGMNGGKEWNTVEKLSSCVRVTAEAGADVIKTFYLDAGGDFSRVVENSLVPLVVLGGVKSDAPLPLLERIALCLEKGACGVAIGRNIWAHKAPAAMTRAIAAVVHEGTSVGDAVKYLS
ncbi:MAG: hypothetical protein GYA45_06155 [Pelolinea sp.]|jgi:DhnA family fructose-bisphosphate aldolase class Ia|nr:hypothetical protein [Pelolinea sp.]